MKFHKATYLFFAVFFLMTKVGVAFNVHYCKGTIADISYLFESKKCCGIKIMETPLPSACSDDALPKKDCCSNEVIVIQNNDQNPLVDQLQLSKHQSIAVLSASLWLLPIEISSSSTKIEVDYQNTSHSPPPYQLYCSYTLYA